MIPEALLTAGAKGFGAAMTKLAAEHAARLLINGSAKVEKIRTNLTPHMDNTFRRCISIKTLLNPYEPVNFLQIYTTQRFSKDGQMLDHYGLVESIRMSHNNIIVTGTGGSGKSMFMRYLWLSLFERSDGRVPIFVELRNLSGMSDFNMKSYLQYTLSQGPSSISQKDFESYLRDGDFIVVLDGFDEIANDSREGVQREIMNLAMNYPNLKIVLSGRPDDRFASWTSFFVYSVCPMEKRDVVELVEKADFDHSCKSRFQKKIKDEGLFETHKSFLSNPLLASMMLLTFSRNYDIPNKMHLFYAQAFDALYQRHDSHKPGGYKREFKTNLSEDSFRRILSYFCLISYYEQKFEFDREEIISFITKAAKIDNVSIDPANFLWDLTSCVCIVIQDGLNFTFSHRSFQEYFAAYCMAYVTSQNIGKIVEKFSERLNDQAALLLSDMNPEKFRDKYVVPMSERFERELQFKEKEKDPHRFMKDINGEFQIHYIEDSDRMALISISGSGAFYFLYELLSRLTKGVPESKKAIEDRQNRDGEAAKSLRRILNAKNASAIYIKGGEAGMVYKVVSRNGRDHDADYRTSKGADLVFDKSPMYEFILSRMKRLSTFVQSERRKSGNSSDAMKEIFEL